MLIVYRPYPASAAAGSDCLLIVYRPYPPAAAAAAAGLSKLVSLNLGVDGLGRLVAGGVLNRGPLRSIISPL